MPTANPTLNAPESVGGDNMVCPPAPRLRPIPLPRVCAVPDMSHGVHAWLTSGAIVYNASRDSAAAHFIASHGVLDLLSDAFAVPATSPPLCSVSLRLVTLQHEWTVRIEQRGPVRVRDVLRAIHRSIQKPVRCVHFTQGSCALCAVRRVDVQGGLWLRVQIVGAVSSGTVTVVLASAHR